MILVMRVDFQLSINFWARDYYKYDFTLAPTLGDWEIEICRCQNFVQSLISTFGGTLLTTEQLSSYIDTLQLSHILTKCLQFRVQQCKMAKRRQNCRDIIRFQTDQQRLLVQVSWETCFRNDAVHCFQCLLPYNQGVSAT